MTDPLDLIRTLFDRYQELDHAGMSQCYHDNATFEDIAFQLNNKQQIGTMWHMICRHGIEVVVADESPRLVGEEVVADITVTYNFSDSGRKVVSPIACFFRFRDGLIIEQRDEADPVDWARKAIGGLKGWIAGHFGFVRRLVARRKIREFQESLSRQAA